MSESKNEMPLLRTKLLVPRAHPDRVARPRLTARLDEGRRRRLTLVSAPAGFGKTTLLSAWIEALDDPVAWLSLDERDNDPTRFWAYVIAALQTVWSGVGTTATAMLRAPQSPPVESVLTELLNDVTARAGAAYLILDDLQDVDDPQVHDGLAFLIEHLPPHLHLVIATRADPPLPLSRLRARRQLVELRAADLRFTPAEAEAFFDLLTGAALSAEDVAAIEDLTEGWAAGLQLAALSLPESEDVAAFLAGFSGSHRYVYDYMAHEVVRRQPPEVQDFLRRTALLDRLSAPICDAVTGRSGSQEVLERLDRRNLFIVALDPQRRWYRYHPLFAGFLRARLAETAASGEVAELHRRAAGAYADRGFVQEAIRHALAAGDFERAQALISTQIEPTFRRSELRTLLGWIDALPEDRLDADRFLGMAVAWAALALGDDERVVYRLRAVERAVGVAAEETDRVRALPPEDRGAIAEVLCVRTSLAFNQMDLPRMMDLSRRARALLQEGVDGCFNTNLALRGVIAFDRALGYEYAGQTREAVDAFEEAVALARADENIFLLPMTISHLAQLRALCGELHAAMHIYEDALRIAEGEAASPLAGMGYTGAAHVLYEWNDLDRAQTYLERGLALGELWSNWEILWAGYAGLADIDAARGDLDRARERLRALTEEVQRLEMPWAVPAIEAHRALLAVRAGDLELASRWAADHPLTPQAEGPEEPPIPYMQEPDAMTLARVWCACGERERALRLVDRLLAANEVAHRRGRVVKLLSLRARILDAQDRRAVALDALSRALTLAEREGYTRTFVDQGPGLRDLLEDLAERTAPEAEDPGLAAYGTRLLEAFGPLQVPSPPSQPPSAAQRIPPSAPPDLLEPLTDRERDVLDLIAQGLTNREIADRLVISVNTVKTHARHIYDKLDVRNRAEATHRALELNLLG